MRCSKCGKKPYAYREYWNHFSLTFDVFDDGSISEEGYTKMGRPESVFALCGCGHEWKLRKISQITELPKYLGNHERIVIS